MIKNSHDQHDKKTLKVLFCLIAALIVVLSCFSGCSSAGKTTAEEENKSETETESVPDSVNIAILKSIEMRSSVGGEDFSYNFEWTENSVRINDSSDNGFYIDIEFDAGGKITKADAVNDNKKIEGNFVYDNGNLIKSETYNADAQNEKLKETSFTYENGRISSIISTDAYGKTSKDSLKYDEAGRIVSFLNDDGTPIINFDWQQNSVAAYDPAGKKYGAAEFADGKCKSVSLYDLSMDADFVYDDSENLTGMKLNHELNEYDQTVSLNWNPGGSKAQAAVSQTFIRAMTRMFYFYEADPEATALYNLINI